MLMFKWRRSGARASLSGWQTKEGAWENTQGLPHTDDKSMPCCVVELDEDGLHLYLLRNRGYCPAQYIYVLLVVYLYLAGATHVKSQALVYPIARPQIHTSITARLKYLCCYCDKGTGHRTKGIPQDSTPQRLMSTLYKPAGSEGSYDAAATAPLQAI